MILTGNMNRHFDETGLQSLFWDGEDMTPNQKRAIWSQVYNQASENQLVQRYFHDLACMWFGRESDEAKMASQFLEAANTHPVSHEAPPGPSRLSASARLGPVQSCQNPFAVSFE